MARWSDRKWKKLVVPPQRAMEAIEPGMSIFVSTGVSEPRTLVRHLLASSSPNLRDLELLQVATLGAALSLQEIRSQKYRLKTFFSGWIAAEAITAGQVDLIPTRFSRIPDLIETGRIGIDVAFVQVTPPDPTGHVSLGAAVDVARQAMERASIVIGEINRDMPTTFGDTFVPLSDFDALVESQEEPVAFPRPPVPEVFDRVAHNVASVVLDGSCLGFSVGPLYEALARHLADKKDLGIHSPFFTDALMDLVKSGAVTNRTKAAFRGKSVVSYAVGSRELLAWLDRNPLVEFQGIDKVFDPLEIGRNRRFVAILPARRVDLTGRIALHLQQETVAASPGELIDFVNGAELSRGGLVVFALPSRNREGAPNIRPSIEELPNQFTLRESVDMVVTEYGVAALRGRTVRERAQALIEIAHPDDRPALVHEAKAARILYEDQIYLADSAHLYPTEVETTHAFGEGLLLRFRAIKPSDEEQMRRLFYRFSDKAVYYRYFAPIKTMPHSTMQQYVNVDYRRVMSIVGLVGDPGEERIIAEGRFVTEPGRGSADIAFVVDEQLQGKGIATHLYLMLVRLARARGVSFFTADVVATNKAVMRVLEKGGLPIKARLDAGVYEVTIPLDPAARDAIAEADRSKPIKPRKP